MAENLNYNNGCLSVDWVNTSNEGWCNYYENNLANEDYGLLYQWGTAMNWDGQNPADITELEGTQGLCPDGWHIPTDDSLIILAKHLASNSNCDYINGCSPSGTKLKASASDTPISWNGSNVSGFTALPSGGRNGDGSFAHLGNVLGIWSSSTNNSDAWYFAIFSDYSGFYPYAVVRHIALSVRCIKN